MIRLFRVTVVRESRLDLSQLSCVSTEQLFVPLTHVFGHDPLQTPEE